MQLFPKHLARMEKNGKITDDLSQGNNCSNGNIGKCAADYHQEKQPLLTQNQSSMQLDVVLAKKEGIIKRNLQGPEEKWYLK